METATPGMLRRRSRPWARGGNLLHHVWHRSRGGEGGYQRWATDARGIAGGALLWWCVLQLFSLFLLLHDTDQALEGCNFLDTALNPLIPGAAEISQRACCCVVASGRDDVAGRLQYLQQPGVTKTAETTARPDGPCTPQDVLRPRKRRRRDRVPRFPRGEGWRLAMLRDQLAC